MTSRRPSFARNPRPSSAIYIGSESTPPLPSPPSPAHSSSSTRSQLPSPPASNSTGSIGDSNSAGTGSIRRPGMIKGDNHVSLSDEENDANDQIDEDHTAKLSSDIRAAKGKQPASSSTIQRVKSLTERNRQVIDRLSSITASDSHPRSSFSTPSGASSSRSRSPLPPTLPSSSSSSRVSFAGSFRGGSGSETEREQRNTSRSHPAPPQDVSSDDNDGATPPATTRNPTPTFDRTGPRQRLRSAPSPAKPPVPLSPRKHTSTTSFMVVGSGRRSRRVSIQESGDDVEEEEDGSPPTHPTVSGSMNKKSRAPLPREFRDRRSLDDKSLGELPIRGSREQERTASPGVLTARGDVSANSSGAGGTFSASPASPRSQRPARPSTLRESSRRAQRWSSVDDTVTNGNEEGRRQWRHAGSVESSLGGREGRSVVGEGLRAAGLARRGSDDVFIDGVLQRRSHNGVGLPPNGNSTGMRGSLDEARRDIPRGLAISEDPRDPRTPLTAPPGSRYGTIRSNTIHSVLSGSTSRAGSSMGSYAADDDVPRSTSQPLRTHRTSYGPGARHTPQSNASPALGTFGRGTPLHAPTAPSSEHARLMMDSLAMFEGQLSRLPPGPPDLVRTAQSVVHSASGLNTLLRAGNARALEAQIEAEVGDAAPQVDASEVWRQVGGEYRESLRMSDELVRTITALLLGVGRLVREAAKERSGSPDVGGGGGGSGRSSLDMDERDRNPRTSRRSMDADGRSSADGSTHRESRRSWEDGESSRRSYVDSTSRPSTSLSMTRGPARQDDGHETARERQREHSSALERLSIRRMFTPRSRERNRASAAQDSPDPSFPTPSPAPRSSLERDYRQSYRSLPPLAVPPPLPSLPSESQLEHKTSIKGRRGKASNTSNATVRGTSMFPGMTSPPNPTTALTPHTVSAGESTAFPLLHGDPSSSALSGLQQQQQRDVRKRTVSSNSAQDTAVSGSSSSSGIRARGQRVRMSLDSAEASQDRMPLPPVPLNGERLERRRTINEIFS